MLGCGRVDEAKREAERATEEAYGTDEYALLLLRYIIDLLPARDHDGIVHAGDGRQAVKDWFASAFDIRTALAPYPNSQVEAIRLEVEANCSRGSFAGVRIGTHAWTRLGDLLLRGSDAEKRFALDQFAKLHRHKVTAYDTDYPTILAAASAPLSKRLRSGIIALAKRIERSNPGATLPILLQNARRAVNSGERVMRVLTRAWKGLQLTDEQKCTLALALAEQLPTTPGESRLEALGLAAKHAKADRKLLAWVGYALGDATNAASSLFDYAFGIPKPFMHFGERHHALQAACRLLFLEDQSQLRAILDKQIPRFRSQGRGDRAVALLQDWRAATLSFERYLKRRMRMLKPREGPASTRSAHRRMASYLFNRAADRDFKRNLSRARREYEVASVGNDAPWILGALRLFEACALSYEHPGASTSAGSVQRLLREAGELLRSPYPSAVALVHRALFGPPDHAATAIRDLQLAVNILEPSTPEVRELRRRVAACRWPLVDSAARKKPLKRTVRVALWRSVLEVVPLLENVIDESERIQQHFAPTRNIRAPEFALDLGHWRNIGDANQRGRWLEHIVTDMIRGSSGLQVLEVRHRSNYEEIDIIVGLTQHIPLLSHWGPMLLVECKNWTDRIGADVVRAFYTKMVTKKGAARLGIIVAPSGFTAGVAELSRTLQDALVISVGPSELSQVARGQLSFRQLLERLVPSAVFA